MVNHIIQNIVDDCRNGRVVEVAASDLMDSFEEVTNPQLHGQLSAIVKRELSAISSRYGIEYEIHGSETKPPCYVFRLKN